MPSQIQDIPLDQIDWDSLSNDQLADVAQNDDRTTAQTHAQELLDARTAPPEVATLEEYNPREDPGPKRYEDINAEAADDTPVDSVEVPLEESRRDETTVLATDQFDLEGNRI